MMRTLIAALALIFLPAGTHAYAQRLYDAGRDAQAKRGADAAGQVSNGDLWERMARNLDRLSKEDIQTYLFDQQLGMRSRIDTMVLWSKVDALAAEVRQTLRAFAATSAAAAEEEKRVAQQQEQLKTQIDQATAAFAKLKENLAKSTGQESTVPDELRPVFDNLGDIDTAVQQLKGAAGSGTAGSVADRISEGVGVLKQLQSVFAAADQELKAVSAHKKELGGLDLDVQRAVLLRLQADEEHFKNLAAIIARRSREEGDLVHILNDFQARRDRFKNTAPDSVPDSLRDAASGGSGAVADQAMALYDAAALASRGRTPAALERLRKAEEEERYSIRRSAAEARAYELLLNGGARRLALYYAGGIKPETAAQLLFNALSLANLGYLTYAK